MFKFAALVGSAVMASASKAGVRIPRMAPKYKVPEKILTETVTEYFFETDIDHFDNRGRSDTF